MDHVAAFLRYAERDRNRSPHTLARYRAVLGQLRDPAGATLAEVQEWWESRYDREPATRANELACLRAFYKWLTRYDHRPDDPTRRLDFPKVPNRIPRPIGEAELDELLTATRDRRELRRAVSLGAYAGLRVSEAAALDWRNVDIDRRRIYVRGKGRKERATTLPPILLDKLLPKVAGNVVTGGGSPYTSGGLQRKVNRLMADVLPADPDGEQVTFHDLRKRWVTLAASEADLYTVATAAGWSSIETVKSYAALSDDALDRIAAAVV